MNILKSVVVERKEKFVQYLVVGATLVDTLHMRYARISRALRYTIEFSDVMIRN